MKKRSWTKTKPRAQADNRKVTWTNLEKQLLVNKRRLAAKALLKAARKDSSTAVRFGR